MMIEANIYYSDYKIRLDINSHKIWTELHQQLH